MVVGILACVAEADLHGVGDARGRRVCIVEQGRPTEEYMG